ACSDDDTLWWQQNGSEVEMARSRAFVLNEGSYGMNNATVGYFDFSTDNVFRGDIFEAQNGRKIGDTAQDMAYADGKLYVVVAGSNYVARLDGVGHEEARLSYADHADLGDPRYVAVSKGKLYVSSYGGYVSRIDAKTMKLEGSVRVGRNPEQLVVSGGRIYCVNSGWGTDNTLSIIDEADFTRAETVTIMDNPQRLVVTTSGKLAIQGTGADYSSPRVDVYDPQTRESVTIGQGSSMATRGNVVYVASSVWSPDGTATSFYSYDVQTATRNDSPLSDMPAEMAAATSYSINVNPYNNHIYVTTTLYNRGDGTVYHFDATGKYIGKFTSNGQNPSRIVFVY
ncbi:MAG: DUF5074 domain-containing protein, partial [Prevotella sp.]